MEKSVKLIWSTVNCYLRRIFKFTYVRGHFFQKAAGPFSDLFQCQACGKHFCQICFSARHVANIFIRSVSVPGMWQTFLSDLFQCQACGKHFYQICYSARHVANIFIRSVTVPGMCQTFLSDLFQCQSCGQWWANLDQASKDLDKTIFRDLSPTPIP